MSWMAVEVENDLSEIEKAVMIEGCCKVGVNFKDPNGRRKVSTP